MQYTIKFFVSFPTDGFGLLTSVSRLLPQCVNYVNIFQSFVTPFPLKYLTFTLLRLSFFSFATTFIQEKLAWNYLVVIGFIGLAAFFAFAFKTT